MSSAYGDDPTILLSATFTAARISPLRHAVTAAAAAAGLTGDQLDDFVLAVNELTTNAIRHGGGQGHLLLHHDTDHLTCQVSDHGPGTNTPPPAHPPNPTHPGHRGLWLAHRLTGGLVLNTTATGLTATITTHLRTQ
ncbi:ATP-binding protein [Micromonospora chalcea]|uniref:ATP-binding protein n=1 Tax=Micromonospora chalcea TaxID=1874 RepID=UPI0021A82752|nr:ATP-binding protein [Micromonospora chalcea]MCT2276781.1 ATP-binding protein [Micromonospora chalcea]